MTFTPPRLNDPQRWRNLNIGLFGGTFNPPHEGHLHVCKTALQTGEFDFIWWMVTPGNPLKQNTPPLSGRLKVCQKIVQNPYILVSDIEHQLGTHKSIDTVLALKYNFPLTNFTFIAGMDNALTLHYWEEWQQLLKEVPFLFVARPPALNLIKNAPVKRIKHRNIRWILDTKLVSQSSTQLRSLS